MLCAIFFPLLALLKTSTIFGGDGGDLVTAAFVQGVAHPPGYPLYTAIAHLFTQLPGDTVAGRVAWLSVLPALGSIVLSFLIVWRIGKNIVTALFASLIVGFSYIFLLLAIIPEVFALHLFLVTLLIYIIFEWQATGKKSLFSWFCFFFGLSLTHHHTILLLVPAFAYFIYTTNMTHKKNETYTVHQSSPLYAIRYTLYFLLGLLPYSYVYFAARGNPVINWENPQTTEGFIRLVTRAIYGTFQSGQVVQQEFGNRILNVFLFLQTVVIDFTVIGAIFAVLGLIYLFVYHRRYAWFCVLGFVATGPFFMYYAGFPAGNDFYLGTIERFFVVPYFFIALCIAFGMTAAVEAMSVFLQRVIQRQVAPVVLYSVFALYPIALGATTIPKIIPLRHDMTAEAFAQDLLTTAKGHSLLLMTEDTQLFDVAYNYYTSGKRYDTTLVFFGLLSFPFYRIPFAQSNPDITVPEYQSVEQITNDFIASNAASFAIFADQAYPTPSNLVWVPTGLLFRLYNTDTETLDPDTYFADNERLFASYQDPLSGALGQYRHVMLADVLRIYARARTAVGNSLFKLGKIAQAREYFKHAFRLVEDPSSMALLIQSDVTLGDCSQAKDNFERHKRFAKNPIFLTAGALLYERCFNDPQTAAWYISESKKYERSLPSLPEL